jgi:hypothetical protein
MFWKEGRKEVSIHSATLDFEMRMERLSLGNINEGKRKSD